jgi:hypothetical protein
VLYFIRVSISANKKARRRATCKSNVSYTRHVVNSSRQYVTDNENRNLCQPRMRVYLRIKQPQVCIYVIVCTNNSWLILQISTHHVGVLPRMAANNDTFPSKAYALDKIKETMFLLRRNRHRPPFPKDEPKLLKRCGSTVKPLFNGQNSSVFPSYSPADTSILPHNSPVDMSWMCKFIRRATNVNWYLQGGSYLCWPVHGDRCTAGCEINTDFADESACLTADNVRNEVVTIQSSQRALKMLSLYT